MNRKKIITAFGGSFFDRKEIDFIFKFVPHRDMLHVGAVILGLEGLPELLPCMKGKCKNGGEACIERKERKFRQQLYSYMSEKCAEVGCRHIVHKEDGCTPEQLLKETQYADLLVISQQNYAATVRNSEGVSLLISQMLEKCGCPVLVLPEQSPEIDQVVLTFDGSTAAMNGIKQFSYLLPELGRTLPITVLTTYDPSHMPSAQEEKLFIEYLRQHFDNLALHKLIDGAEHTLLRVVGLSPRTLMVVNNPSPQNLPLLNHLLAKEKPFTPFKFIAQAV